MTAYRRVIVRLSDKAVRNYMDIRRLVVAQIAGAQRPNHQIQQGRVLFALYIPDSLEDCILTVRRLFRYFERIKCHESGFQLDRIMRKQIESVERSIRVTRDLIEHLDKDISTAPADADHYTAPVLDAETKTIIFGGQRFAVCQLASVIRQFHSFAHDFVQDRRRPEGLYKLIPASGPLDSV